MAEIEIKLKGLAQIKSELRELKGELANATDPTQMAKLAEQAGKLKDQLADANEQVKVFSTGSKFEQVSNSFSSMKDSLMSMDFEEASEKAKMFSKTLGSISPSTISQGIMGLVSTVGTLSKAFISFGMALLTNPIFLLVAAIVAIAAIIGVVMNKLGILKPILDAVGKVFGWIGDAINMVVEAFKALTDWLGLSNNAAEDAADAQAAAAEKTAKAYEEKSKSIVSGYDREIELAKLDGKNTTYQEKQKQYWILKTATARLEATKQKMIAARLSGDLDEEEILALRKSYNEQREVVKDSMHQIEVIEKTESNRKKDEAKKQSEEETKTNQDSAKKAQEAYKARIAAEKQFQQDRLSAIRMIQDLEFDIIEDGITKELALNKIKYQRILEDLATNAKLTSDEKIKLANLYAEEERKNEIAIQTKYQEDLNLSLATATEKRNADKAAQLQLESDTYAKLGEMQKVAAQKKIDDAENERKLNLASAEAKVQLASKAMDAIGGLLSAFQMDNEKDAKKQFQVNKALALGSAFVNTALAVTAALTAGGNPLKLATGMQFVEAGIAAATGAANIIKIASSKFGGGGKATAPSSAGGGASGGGSSSKTSTQEATPNVQMFGANNNANTFGATAQQQQNQPMVIKAVVVESDITSMQNKVSKIQQSAVL